MPRRSRGALEQAALAAVHSAGRPVTVAEVVELLDGDPAYTTVMTTLTRLWSKGALVRAVQGRGYTYAPAAGPDGTAAAQTARRMRLLLDGEGRRADVLARFVSELDPDDEELLRRMLRRAADAPAGGTPPHPDDPAAR